MPRIILPSPAAFDAAHTIALEPDPTITNMELWAYLRTSTAESPNMAANDALLTVTGVPVWSPTFVTLTPGTNFLVPTGVLDTADSTALFVARTPRVGGDFSPIISAYVASAGLMIALGDNEIRFHASGLGTITTFTVPANYGSDFSFWSFAIDSGGAVPVRWKNWTHNVSGTFGTPGASRSVTGTQIYIGGQTFTPTGLYGSDVMFVAKTGATMTDPQIQSCYLSVQKELENDSIVI